MAASFWLLRSSKQQVLPAAEWTGCVRRTVVAARSIAKGRCIDMLAGIPYLRYRQFSGVKLGSPISCQYPIYSTFRCDDDQEYTTRTRGVHYSFDWNTLVLRSGMDSLQFTWRPVAVHTPVKCV